MNYDHIYHAGNFADVFKHLTLILCLEKLHEKDTPFFVMDTHAGCGKYDLDSLEANKTGEALRGIKEFAKTASWSPLLENYLKILSKINGNAEPSLTAPIKLYPGSPYIIKQFLRSDDRAIFAEIRREEFLQLKRNFVGHPKTQYFNEDGFDLLKSKLPPLEKRGLILIDPAFEKVSDPISKDYEKTVNALRDGLKRFSHGIYLVWHPIINKESEEKTLQKFYQDMRELKADKLLHLIFTDDKNNIPGKMNACGMFVINAPWGLEEKLQEIFQDKITIVK